MWQYINTLVKYLTFGVNRNEVELTEGNNWGYSESLIIVMKNKEYVKHIGILILKHCLKLLQ